MGKYYEAIARLHPAEQSQGRSAGRLRVSGSTSLIRLPALAAVARAQTIRSLSESLAPLAVVESPVRVLVSGCRPGDGASTVATALAMDLSQRLGLRTLLVDAHLARPALHRLFTRPERHSPEVLLHELVQVRVTDWPRLELATCCPANGETQRREMFQHFDSLLCSYPVSVVDLGVARLDPRMLPLARPSDPIVLVVRYGHTERQELATIAAALRAANRSVAGVILNGATQPVAKGLRR